MEFPMIKIIIRFFGLTMNMMKEGLGSVGFIDPLRDSSVLQFMNDLNHMTYHYDGSDWTLNQNHWSFISKQSSIIAFMIL